MIINDSLKLNEVKSINLGNGSTAYQSGGKYYIKKGDSKKEISADQYTKLRSKGEKSNSSDNSKSIQKDFLSKYEDATDDFNSIMDDFRNDDYGESYESVDEIESHVKNAGLNPDKCIAFDPEILYDYGNGDQIISDLKSKSIDSEEFDRSKEFKNKLNDESSYSSSTLYKFDDGTKLLEINVGGGYESGVPLYVMEK